MYGWTFKTSLESGTSKTINDYLHNEILIKKKRV